MKVKSLTLASVIAAIAASICCIGPIVAVGLGLSAAGLGAAVEPVRPYLLGLTFVILAFAFYRAYRRPEENCAAGVCEKPVSRRTQTLVLWLGAAIVILFAAFPYYSGTVWNVRRHVCFARLRSQKGTRGSCGTDGLESAHAGKRNRLRTD
jgi:mercuric ion transport protein